MKNKTIKIFGIGAAMVLVLVALAPLTSVSATAIKTYTVKLQEKKGSKWVTIDQESATEKTLSKVVDGFAKKLKDNQRIVIIPDPL
ncbi:MAG: hypothetical protein NT038_07800 [Euryarchaeota archaeon]|nr:hypothetical protein [Euryarchaeota archaeon]